MTFSVVGKIMMLSGWGRWNIKNYLLFVPSLVIICKHVVPSSHGMDIIASDVFASHFTPTLGPHYNRFCRKQRKDPQ